MILDAKSIKDHFSNKHMAICFFNKDARSLLRAKAAGIHAFPFTIECLIDPSLRYRPRVRDMAESAIDPRRIISDGTILQQIVERKAIDAAIMFETGYEEQAQDHLVQYDSSPFVTFEEFAAKCYADYENYQRYNKNAEFNVRWSKYCVYYLAAFFAQNGISVVSAYNAPLKSDGPNDRYLLNFIERDGLAPILPDWLTSVPLRFIIGEDWACGKTTYLVNRMKEGASGIAGDFWFKFVSREALPTFAMSDIFAIKGVIVNHVRRAHESNPGHPVFIKYDGRLEEFVYGIPRDRTYLIKDMHHYFNDCRFVIVQKSDSSRMRALVSHFMAKYDISSQQIDRAIVKHDGEIEHLGAL